MATNPNNDFLNNALVRRKGGGPLMVVRNVTLDKAFVMCDDADANGNSTGHYAGSFAKVLLEHATLPPNP